jgi:hypothetical protein
MPPASAFNGEITQSRSIAMARSDLERGYDASRLGDRGVSGVLVAICVVIVLLAIAFFAFYEPTGNTFTPWPKNASVLQIHTQVENA